MIHVPVKQLRGCAIKFESTTRHYRPLQQEMDAFPAVNLKSAKGSCPFELGASSKLRGGSDNLTERAEREEERDGNGREEDVEKEWLDEDKADKESKKGRKG